jgi:two-component system, OmpR family, phosphate regulon response regulator OmpR
MKMLAMPSIVVLDDDPIVLELLRTVLDDAGYASICGTSLDEVPAGAQADLVISDLVPVKAYSRETALAWIAGLRERFGPVPIVIITAHIAALRERDALGAEGVVGKPFDVEALLAQIGKLLGSGRPRPPTVTF